MVEGVGEEAAVANRRTVSISYASQDAAKVAAVGGKLLTSEVWIAMVVAGDPEA